jgi:hypothetical protein
MVTGYRLQHRTEHEDFGELSVRLRTIAEAIKSASTDSASFSHDMRRLQTELRAIAAQLRALDRQEEGAAASRLRA